MSASSILAGILNGSNYIKFLESIYVLLIL